MPQAASARRTGRAAELVAAALDLLEREGPDAVSLRAVARAVGVSPMAPYNHFADHRALLAAVAEAGFRALQSGKLAKLAGAGAAPLDRLEAGARAYVAFALARPSLYRLMFSGRFAADSAYPGLAEAAAAPAASLRSLVAAAGAADPERAAVAVWAHCHGVAILALDGHVGDDPAALAADGVCRLVAP